MEDRREKKRNASRLQILVNTTVLSFLCICTVTV